MDTASVNSYADSILQAIKIISQNNVKNADYDRTVRAEIKECLDKKTGKYLISYQGIEQVAYAISPVFTYEKGWVVYVLIPSNNSQRVKTIINTLDHDQSIQNCQFNFNLNFSVDRPIHCLNLF